jgi:hypothetical protein
MHTVRYRSLSLNGPSHLQGRIVPMRMMIPHIARDDRKILKTD